MTDDALTAFTAALGKKTGSMAYASQLVVPRRYTSGSLTLDVVLGGGFPGNTWSEVIGPSSSGKTSTILKCVAANQKLDPEFTVFWVGAELFEPEWARKLGVDTDRVVVTSERTMETVLDMVLVAASERIFDCIVVDSYPALVPLAESEGALGDLQVASGARVFSKFWGKIGEAGARAYDGTERPFFGIFMNQWRAVIGGFSPRGTPKTTPGGQHKDYAYYVRLDVTRAGWITENWPNYEKPVAVGQEIIYTTIKNKTASPRLNGTVKFFFRDSHTSPIRAGDYDTAEEYGKLAVLFGVVIKRGGWYYYDDQKWNGMPRLKDALREDKNLQDRISADVMKMVENPSLVPGYAYTQADTETPPPSRGRT